MGEFSESRRSALFRVLTADNTVKGLRRNSQVLFDALMDNGEARRMFIVFVEGADSELARSLDPSDTFERMDDRWNALST